MLQSCQSMHFSGHQMLTKQNYKCTVTMMANKWVVCTVCDFSWTDRVMLSENFSLSGSAEGKVQINSNKCTVLPYCCAVTRTEAVFCASLPWSGVYRWKHVGVQWLTLRCGCAHFIWLDTFTNDVISLCGNLFCNHLKIIIAIVCEWQAVL